MKIKEIISDLKKLLIVKHTVTIIVQEITVFYDSRNHTHQYYTFLSDLKKNTVSCSIEKTESPPCDH